MATDPVPVAGRGELMATAVRLTTNARVTLDANGYGTVRLAPTGEKWEVTHVHVECSSRISESECRWYLGQISPSTIIDGTYSGSTGDTSDTIAYLEDGQAMHFEWKGGDAGAIATVSVSGWKSPPDGGFRAVH